MASEGISWEACDDDKDSSDEEEGGVNHAEPGAVTADNSKVGISWDACDSSDDDQNEPAEQGAAAAGLPSHDEVCPGGSKDGSPATAVPLETSASHASSAAGSVSEPPAAELESSESGEGGGVGEGGLTITVIKLGGKIHSTFDLFASTTVGELKAAWSIKFGPVNHIKMMLKEGRVEMSDDGRTLASYGCATGSTVLQDIDMKAARRALLQGGADQGGQQVGTGSDAGDASAAAATSAKQQQKHNDAPAAAGVAAAGAGAAGAGAAGAGTAGAGAAGAPSPNLSPAAATNMSVRVYTLLGQGVTLEVNCGDTAAVVMQRLESKRPTGMEPSILALKMGAVLLADNHTLLSAGVKEGASLTITLKPKPTPSATAGSSSSSSSSSSSACANKSGEVVVQWEDGGDKAAKKNQSSNPPASSEAALRRSPEERATDVLQGYLDKKSSGTFGSKWQSRFFMLTVERELHYADRQDCKFRSSKGGSVSGCTVERIAGTNEFKICALASKIKMHLRAKTAADADGWVAALSEL